MAVEKEIAIENEEEGDYGWDPTVFFLYLPLSNDFSDFWFLLNFSAAQELYFFYFFIKAFVWRII